ncbi:MAG: ParB/RepB/Spo0J family partition protein [Firmicutes bacterium]|nr:ParB/RepB/Spo0J family partition protein [Bacillota bacterium]
MNTQIIELPLEQIRLGKNMRTFYQEDGVQGLADSLEEVGLLAPILVREAPDGFYELVAGRRRYEAAKLKEYPTLPAIVLSENLSVRQVQLVENLQREDLNPIDKAHAVKAFMEEGGYTKSEAAAKLGVPRTTLTDWLQVLDVPAKYQAAVMSNFYGGHSPLTASHITLAKRFAQKVNSPGMLEVILDGAIDYGLSRAETKRVIDLMLESRSLSLEEAVDIVRRKPRRTGDLHRGERGWRVQDAVASLSQSGHYLVTAKPDDLQQLSETEKRELLRTSRALMHLLEDITQLLSEPAQNTKLG